VTNEVLISWADEDFVVVNGTPAMANQVSTSLRTQGLLNSTAAALNDEIKHTRWFDKSGTYKIRLVFAAGAAGSIMDIAIDAPAGNNLFDGINTNVGGNNQIIDTTKDISRGFHDISFLAEADGGVSDFNIRMTFLQFDLIDEHPVLGESRPAVENIGSMVLLGKHVAEVTESTFTFELADVDLINKYSKLVLEINILTTATLALQAVINGFGGTGNLSKGFHANGSTLTNIAPAAAAQLQLGSTTLISVLRRVFGKFELWNNESGAGKLDGHSILSNNIQATEYIGHQIATDVVKITSIEIKTSTSTWDPESKFTLYGVKK